MVKSKVHDTQNDDMLPDMFCALCGEKMLKELVKDIRGNNYNRLTGERNIIVRYRCPKKNIFNNHDDFTYCPSGGTARSEWA